MDNKQEVRRYSTSQRTSYSRHRKLIDIIETVYRGASKGRGLVVSPKGMSSLGVCPTCCTLMSIKKTTLHATGINDTPVFMLLSSVLL